MLLNLGDVLLVLVGLRQSYLSEAASVSFLRISLYCYQPIKVQARTFYCLACL